MYKLIVMENGENQTVEEIGTFEEVKQHLITTDYFSWIQDNEPERDLPNFEDVQNVDDIGELFETYDYGWWTMIIEVDCRPKKDKGVE